MKIPDICTADHMRFWCHLSVSATYPVTVHGMLRCRGGPLTISDPARCKHNKPPSAS